MTVQASFMPDGRRLHLNHGPIDLVIEAWGAADEVRAAYGQACAAFAPLLETLVGELPLLRAPLAAAREATPPSAAGPVARRMIAACWPYHEGFITPMAAVAGAVADHILTALVAGRRLAKAYVNDGGDIAVYLAPGTRLTCGIVASTGATLAGRIGLAAETAVRGIATSGAPTKGSGGRSFSLGIADAVTVLARDAACADAAATVIANAVDLPGHPLVRRAPAGSLDPDSDLGDRAVTVSVGGLAPGEIATALRSGRRVAEQLRRTGRIAAAALMLQGHTLLVEEEVRDERQIA